MTAASDFYQGLEALIADVDMGRIVVTMIHRYRNPEEVGDLGHAAAAGLNG
jgi:hypothetical protein